MFWGVPQRFDTRGAPHVRGLQRGEQPGVLRWFCDAVKCLNYWNMVGSGCSICFRTCCFTKEKGISHDIVKWFIRNVPQLNRFWV